MARKPKPKSKPLPLSRQTPEAAGLSASLVHESGWPALSITASPQTVDLEFVNRTPLPVEAGPATLSLTFRPGVLDVLDEIALAPESEARWVMTVGEGDEKGSVELMFAGVEKFTLPPGEAQRIRIDGVSAAEAGGSRATRVEFGFSNLFHASGAEIWGSRLIHLPVLRRHEPDRLPQRQVKTGSAARSGPFVAGFMEGPEILNDGKTRNTVVLRVLNTSRQQIALSHRGDEATRFHLSFHHGLPNGEWGLVSSHGDRVTLTEAMHSFLDQPPADASLAEKRRAKKEVPVWMIDHHTVRLKNKSIWYPGEYLDLALDIHSQATVGQAQVILEFENLPGHDDGDLVLVLDLGAMAERADAVHLVKPLEMHGSAAAITFFAGEERTGQSYIGAKLNVTRGDDTDEQLNIDAVNGVWIGPQGDVPAHSDTLTVNGDFFARGISKFRNLAEFETATYHRADIQATGPIISGSTISDKNGLVVPIGTIVMWSNYKGAGIPRGWELCDGENGKPDLRGRFVVGQAPGGAENKYNNKIDNTDYADLEGHGGIDRVTLSPKEMPRHQHQGNTSTNGAHTHSIRTTHAGYAFNWGRSGDYRKDKDERRDITTRSAGNHSHSFTTSYVGGGGSHQNLPPYVVLAYIIKVE